MAYLRVLPLLLCAASIASAEDAVDHAHCDEYIRKWGGPCLEGAAAESDKPFQGVLPKTHREVMGFTVGMGDFAEAKKAFGTANEWRSGDAAASETKLCYSSMDSRDSVTVVFARNNEMSSRIDEIRLIQGLIESNNECAQLRRTGNNVPTRSGLHVGMAEHELKGILGEPTYAAKGLLFYSWQKNRDLRPSDAHDSSCLVGDRSYETLGSGITVRVKNGVVAWVAISYGEYLC